MEFKDFADKPKELIGKMVLYESGLSYSSTGKLITKIFSVTKTGFTINSRSNTIFSLIDGCQKGLTGRQHIGTISKCTLLTEEEANELRIQWKQKKDLKTLRERMKLKLETMTFEQLQQMDLL